MSAAKRYSVPVRTPIGKLAHELKVLEAMAATIGVFYADGLGGAGADMAAADEIVEAMYSRAASVARAMLAEAPRVPADLADQRRARLHLSRRGDVTADDDLVLIGRTVLATAEDGIADRDDRDDFDVRRFG